MFQQSGNPYRGGGGGGGFNRGGRNGPRPHGGGRMHHPPRGATGGIQPDAGQRPPVELCKFYAKGVNCNNGNNCRFSHDVSAAFTLPAHEQAIYSLSVFHHPSEGPMIVSGSADSTIKIWDLKAISPQNVQPYQLLRTKGKVTHLEMSGNIVVCAVDEPVGDKADITVGTVYLYANPETPIPVHRSDDMPYTHPFGEIRSFALFFHDTAKVIVTGGGEGLVRAWKFDPATNKFELLSTFEGHIRAVTSVLLHDQFLWTGSLDHTIRVWEVASGRCLGALTSANNGKGHAGAISCLILTPAGPQNEIHIASGSSDQEVKLWKPNGEFVHSVSHSAWVTALCPFQDSHGGIPVLLVGLSDGSIVIRSSLSMNLLYIIDAHFLNTHTIWSIVSIGQSCFSSAGEDGIIVTWKVDKPLQEGKS